MKIAACLILYYPLEKDIENILTYIDKVDKIYVYDNSENKSHKSFFEKLGDKVNYYHDNDNKGLAIRLNQGSSQAIKDKYEYLLTMDQDSLFEPNNLDQYLNDIQAYNSASGVGIFGLEYSLKPKKITNKIKPIEVDELITSGSVLNLSNFEKIGGFDENLFIDGVDIDYCFATLKQKLKCIQFKNNYFQHSLGEVKRIASIKSLYIIKKKKVIHSPIRIYYMIRNMYYLEKKYIHIFPKQIKLIKESYSRHIKMNINYSPNIFKSLRYKIKAKNDFKHNRMGKFGS